ncbi:unnamed protein product [Symbiodinium natans]|uniref:Uncharacterized protein n=1 Tax=Symbiodinium natans TaxID=878477 RepID=A0A812TBC3_9DINO|nr:unnamed protein product [Symbiodinium natans]
MAELHGLDPTRRTFDELLRVFAEVEDLAHRGQVMVKKAAEAKDLRPADLDDICKFASRLRLAAPFGFPQNPAGFPAAPLPQGFCLPWPTLQEQMSQAKALASGALRAPPPIVTVERADPVSGAAWAVTMRPRPPASAVLFTADGSLPRPGSKGTLQAPQDAPVLLAEGGQVFAVAVVPSRGLSDVVTVRTPKATEASQGSAPAKAKRPADRTPRQAVKKKASNSGRLAAKRPVKLGLIGAALLHGQSYDPRKDALVQKIKAMQRSNEEAKRQWWQFCDNRQGGIRDPTRGGAEPPKRFEVLFWGIDGLDGLKKEEDFDKPCAGTWDVGIGILVVLKLSHKIRFIMWQCTAAGECEVIAASFLTSRIKLEVTSQRLPRAKTKMLADLPSPWIKLALPFDSNQPAEAAPAEELQADEARAVAWWSIDTDWIRDSSHEIFNGYNFFFEHIGIRKGWRTPPFKKEDVQGPFMASAEVVAVVRHRIDEQGNGMVLRQLEGSSHDWLWGWAPEKPPHEAEFLPEFFRGLVFATFSDANGLVEGLDADTLDYYVQSHPILEGSTPQRVAGGPAAEPAEPAAGPVAVPTEPAQPAPAKVPEASPEAPVNASGPVTEASQSTPEPNLDAKKSEEVAAVVAVIDSQTLDVGEAHPKGSAEPSQPASAPAQDAGCSTDVTAATAAPAADASSPAPLMLANGPAGSR